MRSSGFNTAGIFIRKGEKTQRHRGTACEHGGRDQSDVSTAVQLETWRGGGSREE